MPAPAIAPPADDPGLYRVTVEFGDCDPAGIVHFPNFFRWMDAASRHFFTHRGVPPWRDLEPQCRVIGTPLLDVHTQFRAAARYGDALRIETAVTAWRTRSFVQHHRVWRGTELLCESTEVRAFVARAADGLTLHAVAIPPLVLQLCRPALEA